MTTRIDPSSHGHEDLGRYADGRRSIYAEISEERRYQDEKWGGMAHDDNEEAEADFVNYVVEYAEGKPGTRSESYAFRRRMVKVAALAVAAIERADRMAAKGVKS